MLINVQFNQKMKRLLCLVIAAITFTSAYAQSDKEYVGRFFLSTSFQYYGETVQTVSASETTITLGYYPSENFALYGGAGLSRDRDSFSAFEADGYHFLGGINYFWLSQEDDSPINLTSSAGYQYTSLNSRMHNWMAIGSSISHLIDFSENFGIIPMIGLSYNSTSGTSSEFITRGQFFSYDIGVGIRTKNSVPLFAFTKYPNMAWSLSFGFCGMF